MTKQFRARWSSWILLGSAVALLCVANGRWLLPVASWLGPMLLLLFIQSRSARVGLGIGFVAQLGAYFVNWWGIIPVPGAWYFLVAGTYAAAYFVPFVIHRWLGVGRADFVSTLILPTSWVAIEFVLTKFTPYGSWAAIGYTQVENVALLQVVSVTGLPGIGFLMLWFAAVCGWAWARRGAGWPSLRYGLVYLGVLLTVVALGEARILRTRDDMPTVKVAGLTPSTNLLRELSASMAVAQTDVNSPNLLRIAGRLNSDLLRRTRAEAQAGADVVVWSETAARVTGASEGQLLERARGLAREYSVPLVIGVGTWRPEAQPSFENKAVLIGAEGEFVSSYHKARPIVGQESSFLERGDQSVGMYDSEHGRFATVICHDADFPDFMRQVGRNRADILFVPSADWAAITPLHPRMAVVRAVENGCALVRPCATGLSLAVDALGRVLARRQDEPDGSAIIVHVPTRGRQTLYPLAGDAFAYLSLVVLFLLVVPVVPRGWRRGHEAVGGSP